MRLSKVPFRCSFVNNIADETRNPDRSNTENYGAARDEYLLILKLKATSGATTELHAIAIGNSINYKFKNLIGLYFF